MAKGLLNKKKSIRRSDWILSLLGIKLIIEKCKISSFIFKLKGKKNYSVDSITFIQIHILFEFENVLSYCFTKIIKFVK